jgi:hypothetical protein
MMQILCLFCLIPVSLHESRHCEPVFRLAWQSIMDAYVNAKILDCFAPKGARNDDVVHTGIIELL